MNSLISALEFENALTLTRAASWCHDPKKDLMAASAQTFQHFYQETPTKLLITALCTGDVWVQRACIAQALVGTEYLIDAEDLIQRLKGEVWRKSPIRILRTPSNVVSVECRTSTGTSGNIEVPSYAGSLSDFCVPDRDWEPIGTIHNAKEFQTAVALADSFSGLRSDTAERPLWLWCTNTSIDVMATERGSDRGLSLLRAQTSATFEQHHSFGIQGRFCSRCASVGFGDGEIKISVDSEQSRVKFEGSEGWVDLPIVEAYRCQALSRGAPGYFWGQGLATEVKTTRTFRLQELKDGVDIQTPKKGANRNDIVLEFEEAALLISKRSDIRRRELSRIPTFTTEGVLEPWVDCTVDHSYLTDALVGFGRYFSAKQQAQTPELPDAFYGSDEPLDEWELNPQETTGASIKVSQLYCPQYHTWSLRVDPYGKESPDFQIILMIQPKEATADYNESD
jgi:hypothetical protein